MKIVITEKVNKELLDWQDEQTEKIHIVSWTAEVNYKSQHNETNLYHFMRQGPSEFLIQDLPWNRQFVLNYRSKPGSHQLEFKDGQQVVMAKVYLRDKTQYVERLEVLDRFGKTISNLTYSGKNIVQQIDYDSQGHPVKSCFIGKDKHITTYWVFGQEKLKNIGMSLVLDGKETFYNSYWDWHFQTFRDVITSFQDVSEVISYEAPTLSINIKNRQVKSGELVSHQKTRQPQKWIIGFQQQNFWKPRNDVSSAARSIGYHQINFDTPYVDNEKWIVDQLEKYCSKIYPGDLVVWQYPKYSPQLELTMLNWFHEKQVIVSSFIHDISLLREEIKDREHYSSAADKTLLASFDANIVPENFVAPLQRLTQVVLKNVIALAPYDFITQNQVLPAKYSKNIFYAGSLVKFPRLQNIDFKLTVYGERNFSSIDINNSNIVNRGFMPAEDLASNLNEGFGLIWDEDKNNFYRQLYTKWNWPYKFSLYMVSGLPVIAWSGSAIADFIKLSHVGIVVDNLDQITDELGKITEQEFNDMAYNAATIGNKLAEGDSTKSALTMLEKFMFSDENIDI